MTQFVNGHHTEITPDPLASLAGRLTDPHDRESYAAVISYVRALPPDDEFRRLVDLLGLLSLLGQRLPDALAEFLEELRSQTAAASEYHAQIDNRLKRLPTEIATGVDPSALARAMSETFRQQIAASALQDTAALLKTSVAELNSLSAQVASTLKPVTQQYAGMSSTIAKEVAKLTAASQALRQQNETLIAQHRETSRLLPVLFALVLFLGGGICGIVLEKGRMADMLSAVAGQVQQIGAKVDSLWALQGKQATVKARRP